MKRFLVIESFGSDRNYKASVAKFRKTGYLLPEGTKLLNGWQGKDITKSAFADCISMVEAPNVKVVKEWLSNWSEFSAIRVIELK